MENRLIVAKFGGSSVADAEAIKRSAQISFNHKAKITVVSATYGTTNLLVDLATNAPTRPWDKSKEVIRQIQQNHLEIAAQLNLHDLDRIKMEDIFTEIETMAQGTFLLKDLSPKAFDRILSTGERLSSLLFTHALKQLDPQLHVVNFDVRDVMITDHHFNRATPLFTHIHERARKAFDVFERKVVYVTQGFIGMTEDRETTTLGRGGSDYSASILAEAIGADELQIWTDVAGIASTDPRVCPEAKPITEITFKEAAEMATFGAKILHPTTLLPANRSNIPVFVGSSVNPELGGTWIRSDACDPPLVRAIALKKGLSLLTLSTPDMLNTHGFLANIFSIFDRHKVSIDSITTSEISVSLTAEDSTLQNRHLIQDLSHFAKVEVEPHFNLVSLIGNNMNHTAGLSKKVFNELEDINVRMICLGASKHNFCLLVQEDQGEQAVKQLHETFITATQPVLSEVV